MCCIIAKPNTPPPSPQENLQKPPVKQCKKKNLILCSKMKCLFLFRSAEQDFFWCTIPSFPTQNSIQSKTNGEMWMVAWKSRDQFCFPFFVVFHSFNSEIICQWVFGDEVVKSFAVCSSYQLQKYSLLNAEKCYTVWWLWVYFWLIQLCCLHGILNHGDMGFLVQQTSCKGVSRYVLGLIFF